MLPVTGNPRTYSRMSALYVYQNVCILRIPECFFEQELMKRWNTQYLVDNSINKLVVYTRYTIRTKEEKQTATAVAYL